MLLILGLLGGALVSLLMLRTVLAEDAFTIARLQQENQRLAQTEEELREDVARAEAPEAIARKAEELGMKPGGTPLYIDPRTGEVLGEAEAPSRPTLPAEDATGTAVETGGGE